MVFALAGLSTIMSVFRAPLAGGDDADDANVTTASRPNCPMRAACTSVTDASGAERAQCALARRHDMSRARRPPVDDACIVDTAAVRGDIDVRPSMALNRHSASLRVVDSSDAERETARERG